ncbi:hypothetical protein BH10PLA2_BH10PLA2_21200 [soil metagenome]
MHLARKILNVLLLAALLGSLTGCPPRHRNRHKKKSGVTVNKRIERGPHGAPVAYWGDELALEVCIDRATKEASVYVWRPSGTAAEPIAASAIALELTHVHPSVHVPLQAAPQEEDAKGTSSCFKGTNPAFASEEAIYGTIAGKVGDADYVSEFDERARSPVTTPKGKRKK